MQDVIVYTSICGGKDYLRSDQNTNTRMVAFLDRDIKSDIWNVRPVCKQFISPEREAKIYKVLPWQYLDSEYSIWIDGNFAIRFNADVLVDKFLNGYDIALFKHSGRDCIYEEYVIDFEHRTVEPKYLRELQRDKYRKENMPAHGGLFECGIILRRHTDKIKRLCETWWSEISAFSSSDQCSFMYALRVHDIRVNVMIPGSVYDNPYFNFIKHK